MIYYTHSCPEELLIAFFQSHCILIECRYAEKFKTHIVYNDDVTHIKGSVPSGAGNSPARGSYICPFVQPPRQPATDAVCWPLAHRWASSSSGSDEACSSPGSRAPWYCGHRGEEGVWFSSAQHRTKKLRFHVLYRVMSKNGMDFID